MSNPLLNPSLLPALLQGFALSASLIIAIGAQNAFVLRQGLKREHVGLVVLACSAADALLMALGVGGMATLIGQAPWLARLLAGAGLLFLVGYGLRALARALHHESLHSGQGPALSRRAALLQLAGFTLLNPHVYLDTVLLVGSIGAQQPGALPRAGFVLGAASASALWFGALGYGARWLAPLFERPRAWQALDLLIGLLMLVMAVPLWPLAFPR